MVEVLEHPPFTDDISYAFRPDNYPRNEHLMSACIEALDRQPHTFFLPNIFQRKRQPGVFLLHDANLAERTLANHPQQTKLIQVHCATVSPSAAYYCLPTRYTLEILFSVTNSNIPLEPQYSRRWNMECEGWESREISQRRIERGEGVVEGE
ncbi:hypothetical protein RIB2604_02500890 [Aspergillus luchuensis]|uniref:Uncharacterized protein n=1 Tax=Aspergillus kawachii TaxID=1069201 RepID=A0A146FQ24_ASPKA|nr:hypothetical protein RIB2604_02500890 [Aspergillus luchuensis]